MTTQEIEQELAKRCDTFGCIVEAADKPLYDELTHVCQYPGVFKYVGDYLIVWQRNGERVTVANIDKK